MNKHVKLAFVLLSMLPCLSLSAYALKGTDSSVSASLYTLNGVGEAVSIPQKTCKMPQIWARTLSPCRTKRPRSLPYPNRRSQPNRLP